MNDLMKGISGVVFDLGNVLIDLDYTKSEQKFSEYSGVSSKELGDLLVTSNVLKRFEVGVIGEDQFRQEVNQILSTNLSDSIFDEAWCALLGDITVERIDMVRKISKELPVYVLSNTNSIHERAFNDRMYEQHGIQDLQESHS